MIECSDLSLLCMCSFHLGDGNHDRCLWTLSEVNAHTGTLSTAPHHMYVHVFLLFLSVTASEGQCGIQGWVGLAYIHMHYRYYNMHSFTYPPQKIMLKPFPQNVTLKEVNVTKTLCLTLGDMVLLPGLICLSC